MDLRTNINWLQLATLAISVLGFFGIHITASQQNIIMNNLPQLVTGATAVISVATMFYHTFVNHPANKDAAVAMIRRAYDAGKSGLDNPHRVLSTIFCLLILGALCGCASTNLADSPPVVKSNAEAIVKDVRYGERGLIALATETAKALAAIVKPISEIADSPFLGL